MPQKRSRRRGQRRVTKLGQFTGRPRGQLIDFSVTSVVTGNPGAYSSTKLFTHAQLTSDIVTANPRSLVLRNILVEFAPFNVGGIGSGISHTLQVQLNYHTVGNNVPKIPMTDVRTLNLTQITRLAFSLPMDYSEIIQSSTGLFAFSVTVLNVEAGAALLYTVPVSITARYYMLDDFPTNI
jgi:hypothetical protein